MEFLDKEIGAQCQVCGKNDFLPFKCKGCKQTLCLQHRSPALHDCGQLNIMDATSMDCVVCGKSIVYDKSVDANEVWEKHFATECTKKAAKEKVAQKCPVHACRNVLGPSNSYRCGKCCKVVCLSHRNPEAHQCSSIVDQRTARNSFLDRVSSSSSSSSKSKAAAGTHPPSQKLPKKGGAPAIDPGNTIHGSAARRGKPPAPAPAPVVDLESHEEQQKQLACPFCAVQGWGGDVHRLQSHIDTAHGDGGGGGGGFATAVAAPPPSSAAAPSAERCPECSQTFSDAVALVAHFEAAHGPQAAAASSSNNKNCEIS